MDIKQLQRLSFEDLLDLDISKLNKEEVAIVEKRLVRVANIRVTKLKKSGKIGLSKLSKTEKRGFKPFTPNARTKNVRNKMLSNAVKVQNFLQKKTTKVKEINRQLERYKNVIRNTLGNKRMKISDRQAKRVSKLMEKAKEMLINNDANKKMSGSPRLLQQVIDIVKSRKYIRNDEAEQIIESAITKGYEESQRLLNQLNEEDSKGLDIATSDGKFNPFS